MSMDEDKRRAPGPEAPTEADDEWTEDSPAQDDWAEDEPIVHSQTKPGQSPPWVTWAAGLAGLLIGLFFFRSC